MSNIGRPTKYNPEFHPEDFMRLSKDGKHLYQIAAEWDLDRETISNWTAKHKDFSRAVKKGREFYEAFWMTLGYKAMMCEELKYKKVNLGFYVWLTKNNLGWADKQEVKQETNAKIDMEGFQFIEPKE